MRHTLFLATLLLGCGGTDTGTEADTDTDTDADTDADTDTDTGAPEVPVQWKDRGVETSATLYTVYTGGTGAMVAGTEGNLWVISGGAASHVPTGVEDDFQGSWGAGDAANASLKLVGTSGTVVDYTAAEGAVAEDLGTANFYDVDGVANDLTAVSWAGAYTYDGTSWTYDELPGNTRPNAVYVGTAATWAVGEDGAIVRKTGDTWETVTSPTTRDLQAIHGNSDTDLWVVGAKGEVLHWDGSAWSEVDVGLEVNLWGVWQAPSGEVFIVGSNGTAVMLDGEEIKAMPTGSEANLYAVYGTSAENVWAVGNRGEVLRFTGWVH